MFQEPGWKGVRRQPSTKNKEGNVACGPPLHNSWCPFTEAFDNRDESRAARRVLTYINRRLDVFKPQLRSDILKHCDASLVTLHIPQPRRGIPHEFNILNVYNDGETHAAVHELRQIAETLPRISLCAGDFNIQDRTWDEGAVNQIRPSSPFMRLQELFTDLEIQYVHLVNFHYKVKVPILGSEPEMRCKRKIEAWSEEEDDYMTQVCGDLGRMLDNVSESAEDLETTMGRVSTAFERAWDAYSEERKPSRHGKKWWNEDCRKAYQEIGENGGPRNREMRNKMGKTLRVARRQYFDKQIHSMASDRKRPCDLMPWTRERKMPAVEAILDSEGNSCNNEEKLFETLHNMYNAADNREVDMSSMYRELEEFEEREWVKFSIQEFHDALKNCAKNTAPGPDHVSCLSSYSTRWGNSLKK
ncbi:hypothetical protein AGABI2DRAFT_117933 [Agaricus bisporus var. bisporus H97]|uniref:hypothetical protein n=1 Tax=Agaricus bisporus var. bisporus (strain H97 / ATCC MYA-4626 / FGSC 10389) TaxID=936046 RepID=UPI00029F6C7D|nr:hypothetical protein AGABI2DRAFT_117933 [Agaricus bisporus var. bisporus H97]EKV47354.1 hypothetical protein AGABI2DRAFT_117933 [Agaricus bisporus var. bisporus H97]